MTALKCKDGDLAVVINDTIDCRQNLGRIVRLRGPVRVLKPSGMLGWRIKPPNPLGRHRNQWAKRQRAGDMAELRLPRRRLADAYPAT